MPTVLANPYVLAPMSGFSEPSVNQYMIVAAPVPGCAAPTANPYVVAAAPVPGYIETGWMESVIAAASTAVKKTSKATVKAKSGFSGGVKTMTGKTAQKKIAVPKNVQQNKISAAEAQRRRNNAQKKATAAQHKKWGCK